MAVTTAEVRSLAMAVGAQEDEILQPVVVRVAVYVVKCHSERLAAPLVETALLAPLLFEARLQEARTEMAAVSRTVGDQ